MDASHQVKTKSILLAFDGSHNAKNAAYISIHIASKLHYKLNALYVVDASQVFDLYTDPGQELTELNTGFSNDNKVALFEEQGTRALAEVKDLCRDTEVLLTTEMVFGTVPTVVLKSVEQYSLLALGRRGNRHEKEAHHLGRNFRQIIHHAHVPLLISGNSPTQKKFQRILLAYDGEESSKTGLAWLENLQFLFPEVFILCVKPENYGSTWLEERQEEIVNSNLKQWEFIDCEGDTASLIVSTALAKQVDIIMMGAYRHTQLIDWATRSTLNTVLANSDLPVFAIK